jgi:hypothetical protein
MPTIRTAWRVMAANHVGGCVYLVDFGARASLTVASQLDLSEQILRCVRSLTFERHNSADCERSDSPKQLAQLLGTALIEPVIGAMDQRCDFLEAQSRDLVTPFLRHENGNTKVAEFPGGFHKLIATSSKASPTKTVALILRWLDSRKVCLRTRLIRVRPAWHLIRAISVARFAGSLTQAESRQRSLAVPIKITRACTFVLARHGLGGARGW